MYTSRFTPANCSIRVRPLRSSRSGANVVNQYAIDFPGGVAFQSYDSLIAVFERDDGRLTLGRHYDYSATTSKYLAQWLRENFPFWDEIRTDYAGKSLKDTLRKAMEADCIGYNPDMV